MTKRTWGGRVCFILQLGVLRSQGRNSGQQVLQRPQRSSVYWLLSSRIQNHYPSGSTTHGKQCPATWIMNQENAVQAKIVGAFLNWSCSLFPNTSMFVLSWQKETRTKLILEYLKLYFNTHAYTLTHTYTRTHSYSHAHIFIHMCAHTHSYTGTHTCSYTGTHTYSYTSMHTHIHTHARRRALSFRHDLVIVLSSQQLWFLAWILHRTGPIKVPSWTGMRGSWVIQMV